MAAMLRDLDALAARAEGNRETGIRRGQVGTGERSDKRRTFRFREDSVHDHATGRRASAALVTEGRFDLLWD